VYGNGNRIVQTPGLPVLAMLGGYLVVYKLVEKTAIAVLKLEPKPKTRPRL
jgi:hypothetical protein